MKQVVNVAIGQKSFVLEQEACDFLSKYLNHFKFGTSAGVQGDQTMESIEERIAEILTNQISDVKNVVTLGMVKDVVGQIGLPNGEKYYGDAQSQSNSSQSNTQSYNYQSMYAPTKRLYRDPDNRFLAGACGGLGAYFDIDPVVLRIVFVLVFFVLGGGLLVYLLLWIILPKASTPAQKCELRGLEKNAENLSKFSNINGK